MHLRLVGGRGGEGLIIPFIFFHLGRYSSQSLTFCDFYNRSWISVNIWEDLVVSGFLNVPNYPLNYKKDLCRK